MQNYQYCLSDDGDNTTLKCSARVLQHSFSTGTAGCGYKGLLQSELVEFDVRCVPGQVTVQFRVMNCV